MRTLILFGCAIVFAYKETYSGAAAQLSNIESFTNDSNNNQEIILERERSSEKSVVLNSKEKRSSVKPQTNATNPILVLPTIKITSSPNSGTKLNSKNNNNVEEIQNEIVYSTSITKKSSGERQNNILKPKINVNNNSDKLKSTKVETQRSGYHPLARAKSTLSEMKDKSKVKNIAKESSKLNLTSNGDQTKGITVVKPVEEGKKNTTSKSSEKTKLSKMPSNSPNEENKANDNDRSSQENKSLKFREFETSELQAKLKNSKERETQIPIKNAPVTFTVSAKYDNMIMNNDSNLSSSKNANKLHHLQPIKTKEQATRNITTKLMPAYAESKNTTIELTRKIASENDVKAENIEKNEILKDKLTTIALLPNKRRKNSEISNSHINTRNTNTTNKSNALDSIKSKNAKENHDKTEHQESRNLEEKNIVKVLREKLEIVKANLDEPNQEMEESKSEPLLHTKTSVSSTKQRNSNWVVTTSLMVIISTVLLTIVGVYYKQISIERVRYFGHELLPSDDDDLSLFNRATYYNDIEKYASWAAVKQ